MRFTTAAGLVNERRHAQVRASASNVRWSRYDPIAIDEVGSEFLFQVVAERAERVAVVLTTDLPFCERTQVIPNARLCKALLDRIMTALTSWRPAESYRFRRTAEKLFFLAAEIASGSC